VTEINPRTRALEDIVMLARQHGLAASEIAAALGAPAPRAAETSRARSIVVRVLGFLGGTFIFAGVGVFIAMQWAQMNSLARVVATLGSGVAAFALAAIAYRDERYEKAAAPLILIASALEPLGMMVAFQEFGSGGDWRVAALLTSGAMSAQMGAAFQWIRRSTPLFMLLVFASLFWVTALDLIDADGKTISLVMGGSLLLAAAGIDRTSHHEVTPPWYFISAAAFLYGFFDLVEHTPFELAFVAAAAAFVYASVVLHSRTLLFVATLAILAYTGWFTRQHFADSIGWPLALIVFGLLMIGLSALAFRIDRDYVRRGAA
jgi:Predicted membrane protein (DUF2157)